MTEKRKYRRRSFNMKHLIQDVTEELEVMYERDGDPECETRIILRQYVNPINYAYGVKGFCLNDDERRKLAESLLKGLPETN